MLFFDTKVVDFVISVVELYIRNLQNIYLNADFFLLTDRSRKPEVRRIIFVFELLPSSVFGHRSDFKIQKLK